MILCGFGVNFSSGFEISLSDYIFKILLIVNIASYCAHIEQYQDLEVLYRIYKRWLFNIGIFL
ncbi:hypothetical protein X966_02620 [Borrelia parkeri HR1]|nr:hypothetical protein X966_02620 [Borrelia parkeri HR1]